RRRRVRCAHQPEVRRVKIRADEELIADVIHFIDHTSPPRFNDPQLSRRLIGRQIAKLTGALLINVEQDESPRPRQTDRKIEGRIALLVDQYVALRIGAEPMTPDLIGAQRRRLVAYIEERTAVGGEYEI